MCAGVELLKDETACKTRIMAAASTRLSLLDGADHHVQRASSSYSFVDRNAPAYPSTFLAQTWALYKRANLQMVTDYLSIQMICLTVMVALVSGLARFQIKQVTSQAGLVFSYVRQFIVGFSLVG